MRANAYNGNTVQCTLKQNKAKNKKTKKQKQKQKQKNQVHHTASAFVNVASNHP
jgi:hypothetical protein